MTSWKKRICIIGAGPAGLACIKTFTEKFNQFAVTCYETGSEIGGTWVYSDQTGNDKYGEPIYSSLYKDLVKFSTPNIPDYRGLSDFVGSKVHSHSYRIPDVYQDKTILVIGASISSFDIIPDVAIFAKHIYLSYHDEHIYREYPDNVQLMTGVARFTRNGAILTDGTHITFDTVLFNTGYRNHYPFLSPNCGLRLGNHTVRPLYKHIVNIKYPTMFVSCIFSGTFYFPLSSLQANFVLAILDERFKLPSKEDMLKSEAHELQMRLDRGWPERYLHRLNNLQTAYFEDLIQCSGMDPLPKWFRRMVSAVYDSLLCNPMHVYKRYNYIVTGPDSFTVTKSTSETVSRLDKVRRVAKISLL